MQHYIRIYNTVKFLKFTQIIYRIFYILRNKFRRIRGFRYDFSITSHSSPLALIPSISSPVSYTNKTFTFLNLSYTFETRIDWNYAGYGKLWTYNLTYFDFLHQEGLRSEEGLTLIHDFIEKIADVKDGLEPFPISLRGINWVKFLTRYDVKEQKIDDTLYAQYWRLLDNIEYHLLGNHLLENGFSLLFGAYYFQDEKLYRKAKEILKKELQEQILEDGAHFELSPMYHQIMLFRILDCINLVQNNVWKSQELLPLLQQKAKCMVGWLQTITFENGNIPLFNDSANAIAPTTEELLDYAKSLVILDLVSQSTLMDSGYRKMKNNGYEMVVDVGSIGPDYIPGHAHSDIFSFELYVQNQPVIVDTGLSTYETNDRRQVERSTKSHNTVEVDGENQSEVWGGFRVARRAKIVDLKESIGRLIATHDGYKNKEILHTREFVTQEDQIIIIDSFDTKKEHLYVAYFHFYPNVNLQVNGNKLICEYLTLNCSSRIELIEYYYSPEFNTKIKAYCAKIVFHNELETKIKIKRQAENENN